MGEVYRARDTRLDRDAAIKVLPQDFATGPERLARFEREAKLLASMKHANIAGVYGLEDEGDQRFIAYGAQWTGSEYRIYVKQLEAAGGPSVLYSAKYHAHLTSWSPDGRWLSYTSDETGTDEVYVVSFPETAARKYQVSTDGGVRMKNPDAPVREIHIVLNWLEELKQRVAARR